MALTVHLDQAGGCVWRYSRQDMDRETTRYLSAATQLDVKYASEVVRKVINEPIRALAPPTVSMWRSSPAGQSIRSCAARVDDISAAAHLFLGSLPGLVARPNLGCLTGAGAAAATVTVDLDHRLTRVLGTLVPNGDKAHAERMTLNQAVRRSRDINGYATGLTRYLPADAGT